MTELDEKCKECGYYKAFHPDITIYIGVFKCKFCGKETSNLERYDIHKTYTFWGKKLFTRIIGSACKVCAENSGLPMKKEG
jgi:hypothetical protein